MVEFHKDYIIADGLKLSGKPKAINMLSENMFVLFDSADELYKIDLESDI